MSLPITPEMRKILDEIQPYVNYHDTNNVIFEDAPKRIKELHKELLKLSKEQEEYEMSMW